MPIISVGRQLRIDEDILGLDDNALLGLIWIAQAMRSSDDEETQKMLDRRLPMLLVERERRGL